MQKVVDTIRVCTGITFYRTEMMSIVQTSELVQSEPNFGVRLITAVGVGVYILLFYEGNEVI